MHAIWYSNAAEELKWLQELDATILSRLVSPL